MAESKVQKVAKKKGGESKSDLPPCSSCGGVVQWAKWERHMHQTCMTCGRKR